LNLEIKKLDSPCGAIIEEIDLTKALEFSEINLIRKAWLDNHILIFPNQKINDDELERFSLCFGEFGEDPYIEPIEGRKHICAIQRLAAEKAPIFAESWHSDWSFMQVPPAGTCLYGIKIPPQGGATSFANQHLAYQKLPEHLKTEVNGKYAVHSAAAGYAPEGLFGMDELEKDRSMRIIVSDNARQIQIHPLVRSHPETGEKGFFSCFGYITGIKDMPADESKDLLLELYQWQTRPEFTYQHDWKKDMLVLWDNRSLLHRAHGGYEGFDRLLHRTTIAERKLN